MVSGDNRLFQHESDLVNCSFQGSDIVGESPIWSSEERALYWVDILGQKIHRFHPEQLKHSSISLDQPVAAIAFTKNGQILAALRKSLALIDWKKASYTVIAEFEMDKPNNRFNDGKCDKEGRFWVGTMDSLLWDQPLGSLYRVDSDLSVHRILTNISCANGIGWSPDDSVMYFTESFRYAIFAYDYNSKSGSISNGRIFAEVDRNSGGFPDGLTVDKEGYVWSAHCGLGQVVRYSPNGKVDLVIKMPVPRPTSCVFGGNNYNTLYVTSAQETLNSQELCQWPLSGSIFSCNLGITGCVSEIFKGDF